MYGDRRTTRMHVDVVTSGSVTIYAVLNHTSALETFSM